MLQTVYENQTAGSEQWKLDQPFRFNAMDYFLWMNFRSFTAHRTRALKKDATYMDRKWKWNEIENILQ